MNIGRLRAKNLELMLEVFCVSDQLLVFELVLAPREGSFSRAPGLSGFRTWPAVSCAHW